VRYALSVTEFLAKCQILELPRHPYSSNLAGCGFYLFSKIKLPVKGRRFDTIEGIQENAVNIWKALGRGDFQKYFPKWKRCWNRCVAAKDEYFGADKQQEIFSKHVLFVIYNLSP
jgi:hypothetical protein